MIGVESSADQALSRSRSRAAGPKRFVAPICRRRFVGAFLLARVPPQITQHAEAWLAARVEAMTAPPQRREQVLSLPERERAGVRARSDPKLIGCRPVLLRTSAVIIAE
jgi:hypothetical protein